MATIDDLKGQSERIATLAVRIREALTGKTTLKLLLSNPSLAENLLTSTAGLKSQRIVLWGLKEALAKKIYELERQGDVVNATAVDVLPTQAELDALRPNNWLSEGDVIGGWIGYLADRPRVVHEVTLIGYRWHFYGDDENVQDPGLGRDRLDKWLQSYGWVLLSGTDAESIHTEQSAEIAELELQLQKIQTRQFE
jgi:hypothetical protein